MKTKRVVLYRNNGEQRIGSVGDHALVEPINHTSPLVSNTTTVLTSRIVRLGEDGEFETENTIYRPNVVHRELGKTYGR